MVRVPGEGLECLGSSAEVSGSPWPSQIHLQQGQSPTPASGLCSLGRNPGVLMLPYRIPEGNSGLGGNPSVLMLPCGIPEGNSAHPLQEASGQAELSLQGFWKGSRDWDSTGLGLVELSDSRSRAEIRSCS